MAKKDFIAWIEENVEVESMPEAAKKYYDTLKVEKPAKEKPMFTDNGKIILAHMKDNADTTDFTAKEVADGVGLTARAVSGALRKLVIDGFAEKSGEDPVTYALTEKGSETVI